MKSEKFNPPQINPEATNEVEPKLLPIIEDSNSYLINTEPEFPDGKVVHATIQLGPELSHQRNRFLLHKKIADLQYRFYLSEGVSAGEYTFLFKTKEYGYATTNLNAPSKETLESTIADFIFTSNKHPDSRLRYILVQPADTAFSKEDIEDCIKDVLKSPKNTFTEEELRQEYKEFRIFRLYEKLYGNEFRDVEGNRSKARSRYFKSMFRKILPDWEISTAYGSTKDFILTPQEKS